MRDGFGPGASYVASAVLKKRDPREVTGFSHPVCGAFIMPRLEALLDCGAFHPHMLRHGCGFALANAGHDPRLAGLAWAQEHPAHSPLHGAGAGSVQEFLEVTMATPANS